MSYNGYFYSFDLSFQIRKQSKQSREQEPVTMLYVRAPRPFVHPYRLALHEIIFFIYLSSVSAEEACNDSPVIVCRGI